LLVACLYQDPRHDLERESQRLSSPAVASRDGIANSLCLTLLRRLCAAPLATPRRAEQWTTIESTDNWSPSDLSDVFGRQRPKKA
tara:strand:+ start:110 stop:364 length:255 start_codon:yes stop_codon:yes gene_type:complete